MISNNGLGRVYRETAFAALPFSWNEEETHEISQDIYPSGQNLKRGALKTKQEH
jgi:hypothetical protein